MRNIVQKMRVCARVMLIGFVLLAGFSASMNMFLNHEMAPDQHAHSDHSHDHDINDYDEKDREPTILHKHAHNMMDHSHDVPVYVSRKTISNFQQPIKLSLTPAEIPISNLFYHPDRPPTVL